MRKTLAIVFALVLVIALFAGCGKPAAPADTTPPADTSAPADTTAPADTAAPADDGQTYTFTTTFYASEALPNAQALLQCCAAVEERTEGRITFENYFNGTLLGASDSVSGCGAGIADISVVTAVNMVEEFPLNNVMSLPYVATPPAKDVTDAAYNQLIIDCPELTEELAAKNVMYIGLMGTGGMHAQGVDVVLDAPSKFAGKNIDANGEGAALVNAMGGNGMILEVTDYYMSLSTGLIDGQLVHMGSPDGFGTKDFLNTHVVFSNSTDTHDYMTMLGGGLYNPQMAFIMNIDSFNTLPADLQTVMLEEFGKFGEKCNALDVAPLEEGGHVANSIDAFEQRGDTFVFIDEAGRAEWVPYIEQVVEEWVADCAAAGYTEEQCMSVYNHINELFEAAQ